MRSIIFKMSLTIPFTIGKVISASGMTMLAIDDALKYWGMKDNARDVLVIIAGSSTAYVRTFTRFPAIWKLLSSYNNVNLARNTKMLLLFFMISGTFGVLTCANIGIQSYVGSRQFFSKRGLDSKLGLLIIGVTCSSSTFVAELGFVVRNALKNTRLIYEYFRADHNKSVALVVHDKYPQISRCCRITKTLMASIFGALGYAGFAYYSTNIFMKANFEDDVSSIADKSVASIALFSTFLTILLTRIAETYHFFGNDPEQQINTWHQLNLKQKLVLLLHSCVGGIDIVVFAISFYIGCVETFGNLTDIDPHCLYILILSFLPAISSGFLHGIFSIRRMVRDGINYFQNEPETLVINDISEIVNYGSTAPKDRILSQAREGIFNTSSSTFDEEAERPVNIDDLHSDTENNINNNFIKE